jgi:hypothetical protein
MLQNSISDGSDAVGHEFLNAHADLHMEVLQ